MKLLSKTRALFARARHVIGSYVLVWLAVLVWYRTLLADEEEEEEGGDVGSAYRAEPTPIPSLEPHQQAYLDVVDHKIQTYSRMAAKRLARFRITAASGLVAALSVPVAVAAGAPGWTVAALGAVAAMSQGLQQIFQDQRHSVEAHALAVEISRARRKVGYVLGKSSTRSAQRGAFDDFVGHIEDIAVVGDERLIGILRDDSMPTVLSSSPTDVKSKKSRS